MSMLCLFAHHRCASSWSNDILRELCTAAGWRHRVVHNPKDFGYDLAAFCRQTQPDVLTLSNAKWQYLELLPPFVGLHLIRDPRDILVSSYFSHRNSHPTEPWPELAAHRQQLQRATREEGLMLELECRAEQFADLEAWDFSQDNILECRVETMVTQAVAGFCELLAMGQRLAPQNRVAAEGLRRAYNRAATLPGSALLPPWRTEQVSASLLSTVAARNAFSRKSGGRPPGEADPDHHYRSGVSGDWRKHFFPQLEETFKLRHGGLLIKLGYEQNEDW